MVVKFIIEFLLICALLYGYLHEEDIATWERKKTLQIRALWAYVVHRKKGIQ